MEPTRRKRELLSVKKGGKRKIWLTLILVLLICTKEEGKKGEEGKGKKEQTRRFPEFFSYTKTLQPAPK